MSKTFSTFFRFLHFGGYPSNYLCRLPCSEAYCLFGKSETVSGNLNWSGILSLDITGRYRYPPPNDEWLALSREEVIDAELPIVDSHHHLWEQGGAPYLLDQIAEDLASGHRVEATVFVQANYAHRQSGPSHLAPVGETEAVARIRAAARERGLTTDVAAAIVGFADLTLGDRVEEVIDAHLAAAPDAFRGIRHSVARDEHFPDGIVIRPAPARLLDNTAYRDGLKVLSRRGLSYDAMIYHEQIDELADCASALPDLPIVLDHYGCMLGVGAYAGRPPALFESWRQSMKRLAERPNVSVKVGGLGMIICGATWHELPQPPSSVQLAEDWRPYFETTVGLFGPQRCMVESNFPVDKAMWSYRTLWNAFKRLTSNASEMEREALFSGTARRFYGIESGAIR
jgi:L-fuconolactonase